MAQWLCTCFVCRRPQDYTHTHTFTERGVKEDLEEGDEKDLYLRLQKLLPVRTDSTGLNGTNALT